MELKSGDSGWNLRTGLHILLFQCTNSVIPVPSNNVVVILYLHWKKYTKHPNFLYCTIYVIENWNFLCYTLYVIKTPELSLLSTSCNWEPVLYVIEVPAIVTGTSRELVIIDHNGYYFITTLNSTVSSQDCLRVRWTGLERVRRGSCHPRGIFRPTDGRVGWSDGLNHFHVLSQGESPTGR